MNSSLAVCTEDDMTSIDRAIEDRMELLKKVNHAIALANMYPEYMLDADVEALLEYLRHEALRSFNHKGMQVFEALIVTWRKDRENLLAALKRETDRPE